MEVNAAEQYLSNTGMLFKIQINSVKFTQRCSTDSTKRVYLKLVP